MDQSEFKIVNKIPKMLPGSLNSWLSWKTTGQGWVTNPTGCVDLLKNIRKAAKSTKKNSFDWNVTVNYNRMSNVKSSSNVSLPVTPQRYLAWLTVSASLIYGALMLFLSCCWAGAECSGIGGHPLHCSTPSVCSNCHRTACGLWDECFLAASLSSIWYN